MEFSFRMLFNKEENKRFSVLFIIADFTDTYFTSLPIELDNTIPNPI